MKPRAKMLVQVVVRSGSGCMQDGGGEGFLGRDRGARAVRVLLAEDEALVAMSMADVLEEEGFDTVIASDGAAALDVARQLGDRLDVLVTDLNMPFMSGEDLIRALRVHRPDLPVIVVTGSPPLGGVTELLHYGGGHGPLTLLSKPIDYIALVDALRQTVSLGSS